MIEIYSSAVTMLAQLVAQSLSQHGLHPMLKNENLASMVDMSSIAMTCTVWVPVAEVERARSLLSIFEENPQKVAHNIQKSGSQTLTFVGAVDKV